MPVNINRYEEDVTGQSSDNLVVNEEHTLPNLSRRVVATVYGAFFEESLVIVDVTNNRTLNTNQFSFTMPARTPSRRLGRPLYYGFVITDTTVSANIRISYQCLGGPWAFDQAAMAQAINTLINDRGVVNWQDIVNKPSAYPAAPHIHDIGDMYGFEYMTEALYMIREAIQLDTYAGIAAVESTVDQLRESLNAAVTANLNQMNALIQSLNNTDSVFRADLLALNNLVAQLSSEIANNSGATLQLAALESRVSELENLMDNLNDQYVQIANTGLGTRETTVLKNIGQAHISAWMVGRAAEMIVPPLAIRNTDSAWSNIDYRAFPVPIGTFDNVQGRLSYLKIAAIDTIGYVVLCRATWADPSVSTNYVHNRLYYGVREAGSSTTVWKELINSDLGSDMVRMSMTNLGRSISSTLPGPYRENMVARPNGSSFIIAMAGQYTNAGQTPNLDTFTYTPDGRYNFHATKFSIKSSSSGGYAILATVYDQDPDASAVDVKDSIYIGVAANNNSNIKWQRIATRQWVDKETKKVYNMAKSYTDYRVANQDYRGKISPLASNRLMMRSDGIYLGDESPPEYRNLYVDAAIGNDDNPGTIEAPLKTFAKAAALGTDGTRRYIHLKENQVHVINVIDTSQVINLKSGILQVAPYGPGFDALPGDTWSDKANAPGIINLNTRLRINTGYNTLNSDGTLSRGVMINWCEFNNLVFIISGFAITFDYNRGINILLNDGINNGSMGPRRCFFGNPSASGSSVIGFKRCTIVHAAPASAYNVADPLIAQRLQNFYSYYSIFGDSYTNPVKVSFEAVTHTKRIITVNSSGKQMSMAMVRCDHNSTAMSDTVLTVTSVNAAISGDTSVNRVDLDDVWGWKYIGGQYVNLNTNLPPPTGYVPISGSSPIVAMRVGAEVVDNSATAGSSGTTAANGYLLSKVVTSGTNTTYYKAPIQFKRESSNTWVTASFVA